MLRLSQLSILPSIPPVDKSLLSVSDINRSALLFEYLSTGFGYGSLRVSWLYLASSV